MPPNIVDGHADLACDAPILRQLLDSEKVHDIITDVIKSGSTIREEH